jgi:two-component system sensor histidine kinase EvgS
MLKGLLDATRGDLAELDEAIRNGDAKRQGELLHRIHGALRLLGDQGLTAEGDSVQRRDSLLRYLDELEALLIRLDQQEGTEQPAK